MEGTDQDSLLKGLDSNWLFELCKIFCDRKTLRIMYTGIVEPHFPYCCSVWGCCGVTEINQLQRLQNWAGSANDTKEKPNKGTTEMFLSKRCQ